MLSFLNGDLIESVYISLPTGFDNSSSLVCRLKKIIYDLKQAPRGWYHKPRSSLLSLGFFNAKSNDSLFIKSNAKIL